MSSRERPGRTNSRDRGTINNRGVIKISNLVRPELDEKGIMRYGNVLSSSIMENKVYDVNKLLKSDDAASLDKYR